MLINVLGIHTEREKKSSHLVKKFFLHAPAWKQVLFFGLAYIIYIHMYDVMLFLPVKEIIHSHIITFLFSLIVWKNTDIEKKL